MITVDALEQLPLHDATGVLGTAISPICFCVAGITGRISGELVLAFDDLSGFALADLLLNQSRGMTREWQEMEISAALETANIVGCAYLNALARTLPVSPDGSSELIPTPPCFRRDFAESLLQSAVLPQAATTDRIFLANTRFQIDENQIQCSLLWIPDADSVRTLRQLLREME